MSDGYLITPEIFTNKMNVLIYGDPGSGKTHLAGTCQDVPNMADVHVFNIDGGIMTLASRGDIHATIFHDARIARARAVHSDAVAHNIGNGLVVDKLARSLCYRSDEVHLARVVAKGLNGLLLRVIGLVTRTRKALDAQFALRPRVADAGLGALPHHIPFALVASHLVAISLARMGKITSFFPHSQKVPFDKANSFQGISTQTDG
jgi:hypothetical protein